MPLGESETIPSGLSASIATLFLPVDSLLNGRDAASVPWGQGGGTWLKRDSDARGFFARRSVMAWARAAVALSTGPAAREPASPPARIASDPQCCAPDPPSAAGTCRPVVRSPYEQSLAGAASPAPSGHPLEPSRWPGATGSAVVPRPGRHRAALSCRHSRQEHAARRSSHSPVRRWWRALHPLLQCAMQSVPTVPCPGYRDAPRLRPEARFG